jgi:large subunit ribosomal protein L29
MKQKDIQDLRNKPDAELVRLIEENFDKLRVLRFDLAAGKVKDIFKIHEARKTIARMKTFLKEREIANHKQ